MLVLTCSAAVAPCPAGSEQWVSTAELSNVADFGITAPLIAKTVSFGFGVVLLGFLLGYVLGLALGLIKKV